MKRASLAVCWALSACASAELEPLGARLSVGEEIDFGDVAIGAISIATFPIINVSSSPLEISGVTAPDNFTTGDYEFAIAGVPERLEPHETVSINVGFQPLRTMEQAAQSSFRILTPHGDARVRVRGRGIEPFAWAPDRLEFGEVLRGASKELSVTLSNNWSADITVPARIVSRTEGLFELVPGGNTELIIAAKSSLALTVRYTPSKEPSTLAGDRGELVLRSCDHSLCEFPIPLSGTGSDAALDCEPLDLDFGSPIAGEQAARSITCRPKPNTLVYVSEIPIDPPMIGFTVEPDRPIPTMLDANETMTLTFRATPSAESEGTELRARAMISGWVPATGRGFDDVEVTLRASPGRGSLEIAPVPLDFGRVALGTANELPLMLTNIGARPLAIRSLSSSDPAFALVANLAATLMPGETIEAPVLFQPTAAGPITAEVIITTDSAEAPVVRARVRGVGADLPYCTPHISTTELDWGAVRIGHRVERDVWIENGGTGECLFHSARLFADSAGAFTLVYAPSEQVLFPGASSKITVAFTPRRSQLEQGRLTYYVSVLNPSNPQIRLSGTGSTGGLIVAPEAIDFGRLDASCTESIKTVRLHNAGPSAITVESTQLSGEFELVAPFPGNVTLPPYGATELQVRYRPSASGLHTGELHIREANRLEPYIVGISGEVTAGGENEERFVQRERAPIDLLFVVDNTSSMIEEQLRLADAFDELEAAARVRLADYQIAVISTHSDLFSDTPCPELANRPNNFPPGDCGYFADGSGNEAWRIITPDESPSPQAAFSANVGLGNAGFEEVGFESAHRALSPLLLGGWNAGFLREDADLALIFVSDEEEMSQGTVEHYFDAFLTIKGFRQKNRFSAWVLGGDVPGGCATALAGARYFDLAERTGGRFESICGLDYGPFMQSLGLANFGGRSTFILARAAIASTIEITVDRIPLPPTSWTYLASTQAIHFGPFAVPPPGSELVVRYQTACD